MCGVYGIYSSEFLGESKLKRVRDIGDEIKHRGPDGEGFWYKDIFALGHSRLSLLDVTDSGVQSMHYKKGCFTIAYNGEIYYFSKLNSYWANLNLG